MPRESGTEDPTTPAETLRRLRKALEMAELANARAVDELLEIAHPEIAILSVPGVTPGPGYFGHAGLRDYFTAAAAHGTQIQIQVDHLTITSKGTVFAGGRLSTSVNGVTESLPAWFVYRFQDNLLRAVETYLDHECAWQQALSGS